MKFTNVAKYFDRDSVYDGYTGDYLFKGQFSSFDAGQVDGSFQRRRILSVAPGIEMPQRRSVKINGELWLSAALMADAFFDKPVRRTTPCMLITDTLSILSPAQAALRASTGYPKVHAHVRYMNDNLDGSRSSDADPYFNIYIAETETLLEGYFLKSQDTLYHVRSVHNVPEGFVIGIADQISRNIGPNWVDDELWDRTSEVIVEFSGGVDPVTEAPIGGVTTTGIMLDIARLFRFNSPASPIITAGDRAVLVAKTAVPAINAGESVKVNLIDWRIYSVQGYEDAWLLHLKRT